MSRTAGTFAGDDNARPAGENRTAKASTRTRPRPSPLPKHSPDSGLLMADDVGIGARVREFLLCAPVLLTAAMTVLAVVLNRHRLALDLAGGRLLPVESLGQTWSAYLASWHPVGGGSAAPPPAALAVLGILGLPFGSPAAAVSLLLLAALPLAALSAYRATCALPVSRKRRALVAAGYALLPPAVAGLAQGRLDVVVVYLLLPLVLAGVASVLRGGSYHGGAGPSAGWLSSAALTAIGVAVLGAFSPLLHLMVLTVLLIGFVLVPDSRVTTPRRAIGLFAVVLLPLGLLVPWPAVVIQRPSVLLHGVGAVVPEQVPGWLRLLTLDPGGAGAAPWVGAIVVVAAVLALVVRPSGKMLPGLGVALLGALAVTLLTRLPVRPLAGGDERPGFAGGPLLFASCGLLWIVLLAGEHYQWRPGWRRALPVTSWVGLAVLAVAAVVLGSGGPLSAGPPAGVPGLAPSLVAELARGGTSVLVVGAPSEPVRLTKARTARFGDDDIAPLRATDSRLRRVAAALRDGQPGETSAAIADVAATGVQFVVLPTAAQGARALASAGPLARSAPQTTDGRPVLRVVRPVPGAELLGPALAEQARSGAAPPIEPGVSGVLAPAQPPRLAVRIAPGAQGRLLVVAANDEPGWRASVDGRPVPVVRGWGHQVAIPVGDASVEVQVVRSDVPRTAFLLLQGALLLLVVGSALPSRRRLSR